MSAYLDASAILPLFIDEPVSDRVAEVVAGAEDLVVSEYAAAEVASALSRLIRTGALDSEDARARLTDFDAWRAAATADLAIAAADIRLANMYVRRFELGLRAPDALHAALCRRADCRLFTLDKRLAFAAQDLGIQVKLLS